MQTIKLTCIPLCLKEQAITIQNSVVGSPHWTKEAKEGGVGVTGEVEGEGGGGDSSGRKKGREGGCE